jgi:hypothetical protein
MRNKRGPHSRSRFGTILAYVPCIRPEPPSPLRQLAYQEGSPIMGPDIDTDGWKTLESVSINGTVFNDRLVKAKCTVSLVKDLRMLNFNSNRVALPRQTCKLLLCCFKTNYDGNV